VERVEGKGNDKVRGSEGKYMRREEERNEK